MGFIAFGAEEARLLKSTHTPKITRRSSDRSLADDNRYHARGLRGSPLSWDEDCEPGNWLEAIDQTRITHFDLTWTSNDMEIDDGM